MSDTETRTAAVASVIAEVHDAMLAEYDHGMTDALSMVHQTFSKISEHPEISEGMKPGLSMAIMGIETLIEEHARVHDAKDEKTETAVADS